MSAVLPEDLGPADLAVLPADDGSGYALVLGRPLDVSDLGEEVDTLTERYTQRIVQNLGLGGRFAGAFDADHGRWIRLTTESAGKLKELGVNPDSAGLPMGVLRGEGGTFAHMTRFDFVSPVPFDPSTFVAALAVQQVVKQIEAKLEEIAQDVQALVRGSKNELEAQLASASDVIIRVERRVRDRGIVDADDWASLANLEPIVKQAYHQTFLWLDPLRSLLADSDRSIVERVRSLKNEQGIRDADFWLRMHVQSELTLKRWELLYLIRESEAAPERLPAEAALIRQRAEDRHAELLDVIELMVAYLGAEDDADSPWHERVRFLSRHRLALLHYELAKVANAYSEALRRAQLTVPEYIHVDDPGPLIDVDEVQRYLREQAMPALETGARSAADAVGIAGRAGLRALRSAAERIRDAGNDRPTPD